MSRRRPFWGNIAALATTHRGLAERMQTSVRPAGLQIEEDQKNVDVFCSSDGDWHSLSGGAGTNSETQALCRSLEQKIERESDLLIFLGFPNARLLLQAWDYVSNANRGILIVEPDLNLVAVQLETADLRIPLQSGKVHLVAGENWSKEVERVVIANDLGGARTPYTQAGYVTVAPSLQESVARIVQRTLVVLQRNAQDYRDRVSRAGWWTRDPHYRPGKRLWCHLDLRGKQRFSLVQYHLVRHLLHGLRVLGWQVHLNVMRDDRFYPWYQRIADLSRFRPDAVLFINEGASFESALGAQVSAGIKIPKVTWWVDDPVYCRHFFLRHGVPEGEYHTAADDTWVSFLQTMGAQRPLFLPGACTYKAFGRRSKRLECQISFVGQVRDQREFFSQLPKEWRDFAERVVELKVHDRFRPILEVMDEAQPPNQPVGEDYMDELRQKLLWEANTRYRVRVIESLADLDILLYGNDDWLALLKSERLKSRFRGLIPYRSLPHLIRSSLVSLNIHSLQTTTCMNVRDFDVPMAGGFLATDLLPGAERFFDVGLVDDLEAGEPKEFVCYRSLDELRRIVALVSDDRELRDACMARARGSIAAKHMYIHRAALLSNYLDMVRTEQGS